MSTAETYVVKINKIDAKPSKNDCKNLHEQKSKPPNTVSNLIKLCQTDKNHRPSARICRSLALGSPTDLMQLIHKCTQ